MQLTLYNNYSAENVVHKNLSVVQTLNGTLKENVNMENVIVTVPYTANFANINYAYIPDFKRYYFVSVDVLNGLRLRLNMRSDPLTSFWGQYKQSQCIAKRSSTQVNPDIADTTQPFSPQPKYIFRKLSTGFTPSSTGYCYVLTLGGK